MSQPFHESFCVVAWFISGVLIWYFRGEDRTSGAWERPVSGTDFGVGASSCSGRRLPRSADDKKYW